MGIKHSVIADISQNVSDGKKTYYGKNGNTIGIKRTNEPNITTKHGQEGKQPLKNYKQYHHKLPEDDGWWSVTYKLTSIYHGNEKQVGFEKEGYLNTHKALEVVYWSNDEHNSLPLIIGLGEGNPTYFKRENETNRWEYSNIVPPADLSDYQGVLNQLNENFKNVVIVNLNAKNGQKYCGHPSKDEFKDPKDNPKSCSQNGTSFVTITVSEINGTVPSGFKGLKHSPSGNKMRVLGTYHGNSMISFKESIVATECGYVNVYYTSGNTTSKPLLLELSNGADQETSKLYTLTNNKWVPSNLSKNDLTQVLDQENCLRNSIVLANVFNKTGYFCCSTNKHNIQVHQNSRNQPVWSELYEHTLQTKGVKETTEPSFNKHRLMEYDKDFTWPGSSMTDIKKIYVYFCGSNTNMPLLVYMDDGEGSGKWLKKIYGGNTWTEVDSGSLSGIRPTDDNSKDKIGKELHEIGKKLNIGCEHTVTIPVPTAPVATPPHPPIPPSFPGAAGSSGSAGTNVGSGSSGSGSSSSGVGQSSSQQDTGVLPNGRGPSGPVGRPGLKGQPQDTGIRNPGEGSTGQETTKSDISDSSHSGNVGSSQPGSANVSVDQPETDKDDQSHGDATSDSTDKRGPFQKVIEFIKNHHNEIAPSVGGVLGTGILGLAVWKGPALFSKVLAICITSV
ncbi:hypothetical protein BEWA_048980 [Theileria equi strain WA]|uniref:Uncharacterized protein n=1 Tax=Theileria equi strain WA TaxID=1537102 RepID=L1LAS8_THEEQ|nr:hypothetical protein BEWA_048980 [Theileria equi strain WA]EKX72431.1 hypothetical protein BEWA_048980 [Theileria equi strain WA]|eukprot:XP_004831883.1 hypothetical protein BEWA_048980 [Theileria equi strain WA]